MNCRDLEPLLSAERDGVLTAGERSSLDSHVASCPACAELKKSFSKGMDAFKNEVVTVSVPDADEAWQKLRVTLNDSGARAGKRGPLTPLLWFAAPLAAAAAIAFAFFNPTPTAQPEGETVTAASGVAQAEYVEPGDAKASTIVYVDKDSGWLVVWATDGDSDPSI
jgi:anti-sigma factor RsiW